MSYFFGCSVFRILLIYAREGWVESRLRILANRLEMTPNVKYAQPFTDNCKGSGEWSTMFFLGLVFSVRQPGSSVDLTPAVSSFTAEVKSWPQRTLTMDLNISYLRQ